MAVLFKIESFNTESEAEKRIKHLKDNKSFYGIEKEPNKAKFNEFWNEWQITYSFKL